MQNMSSIEIDFIKDCISKDEINYKSATSEKSKLNHLYSIIMFKSHVGEYDSIYLYKDIKLYINHAINCIDTEMYGYDKLNREAVLKLLDRLDKKQRLEICGFLLRRIKQAGIVDEEVWALSLYKNHEIVYLMSDGWEANGRLHNSFKLILCLTSFNLLALFVWFVIVYLVLLVLLMPAKYDCLQFFNITYNIYFNDWFYNHCANVLSLLLGIQNDLKITPINAFGFALIAVGKILLIIVVANYGMKLLEKRLNQ